MADDDGVVNMDEDHGASPESTPGDLSAYGTITPVAASKSKFYRMDHDDDDGAPTSSSASTKHKRDDMHDTEGGESRDRIVSFDSSAESTPRKSSKKIKPSTVTSPQTAQKGQDLSSLDMKSSWDGSAAGLLADPAKIAKEREKEERVRQARERLMEERQKKLEELREQQKMAQENREKQLEMRRRKIEDLRKRDIERRIAVEERRKMKEEVERARRESILQKAEERVARYEAWKAGGRKGGRGHVLGFGSATPRDICQPLDRPRRSSSQSALQRRSPNGSDLDSMRPQRRAISACSVVRRHVDSNRIGSFGGGDSPPKQLSVSTSVLYTRSSQELSTLHPPSRLSTSVGNTTSPTVTAATHYYPRPTSVAHGINPLALASMTASLPSPVRMREAKPPRKPRPASVASCMPSLISGDSIKPGRSQSSDRPGRDRSRTRKSRREELLGKKGEGERSQAEDSAERAQDIDADKDAGQTKEKKDRVSLSFSSRFSAAKHQRKDQDQLPKDSAAKKDAPIIRQLAPRKAYSTSNLATMKKKSSFREKQSPTHLKEPGPKAAHRSPVTGSERPPTDRSVSPGRREADRPATVRTASPLYKSAERSVSPNPFITPPPSATSTPTSSSATLGATASLTTSFADDGTSATRAPAQDISADEYKARLAEKRRQAREKAEREAEEERKRQEEARLAQEERQREEEEDEKRFEEESLRLAEEAHAVEKERLMRAIEIEEKRRKEEAEKLEQERRSKEEAERRARTEYERLEKQKQERARKEDEERLERKKKLEMIMKRVKTDTEGQPKLESPTKPTPIFPGAMHLSSSQSSPEEEHKSVVSIELSDDELPGLSVAEGSAVKVYSDAMTTSFMQDFEQDDMVPSDSASTAVISLKPAAGHVQSLPGEPEMASVWSDVAQKLDEERQQKVRDAEHARLPDNGRWGQSRMSAQKEETEKKTLTNDPAKDRLEHGRKEDEERIARKKKLEMIMKRVKTDTEGQPKLESPTKPTPIFPGAMHLSSSQSSPEEEHKSVVSIELSDDELPGLSVAEGSAVQIYSDAMTMSFMQNFEQDDMTGSTCSSTSTVTRSFSSGNILDGPSFRNDEDKHSVEDRSQSAGTTPSQGEEKRIASEELLETKSRFKSPLLQHLVENKGSDSTGPKFKSPLLQNLLSKTKVGARIGLSASVGDLSPSRELPSSYVSCPSSTPMTVSTSSGGSPKDEDKPDGQQNHSPSDRYMFTNGVGRDSGDGHLPMSSSKSSFDSSPFEGTKLFTPMRDSALGSSIEPYGDSVMSQSPVVTNGHGSYTGHGIEDYRIDLCYSGEGVSKSLETLAESETLTFQSDGQSQDLMDLGGVRSDVSDYLS